MTSESTSFVVYIYALCDPDSGETRYIGKTKSTLEHRLKQHIIRVDRTHKSKWVQTLVREGKKPVIRVIEETTSDGWPECERKWIAYYRSLPGSRLLNHTAGGEVGLESIEARRKMGDAIRGRKHSPETKALMSQKQKGRVFSPEHKAAISAAKKGQPNVKLRGRKRPTDVGMKISLGKLGKRRSAETIAKLRGPRLHLRRRRTHSGFGQLCLSL